MEDVLIVLSLVILFFDFPDGIDFTGRRKNYYSFRVSERLLINVTLIKVRVIGGKLDGLARIRGNGRTRSLLQAEKSSRKYE